MHTTPTLASTIKQMLKKLMLESELGFHSQPHLGRPSRTEEEATTAMPSPQLS
jgi:hypothetical protein